MTDAAKQVAQQADDRLDKIAETIRERFEEITRGRFTDVVKEGRFADRPDHGADREPAESRPGG
ncbi:hypothetical protein ABTX15_03990 [Micromonospora sp. NPDC094482]|uniref:hypothetical protein n=1 Tax=unclassified Micromonospora TaxID=2617518 RepID=UPI00332C107C